MESEQMLNYLAGASLNGGERTGEPAPTAPDAA